MRCARCQFENREGVRFCEECGAKLELACPACGASVPPGRKFCGSCGHALTDQPPAAPRFPAPDTYTPKYLAEKILTSKSALEGERKQVTVLFADLKGSMELLADRDPEEARKLLDPVLERMMEAVHRYEGTVNQVMGDGIMALFGAPVAHEDHAARACYAALDMQAAIRRYSEEARRTQGVEVQIRAGLNSGEVVVRAIGSDLRMDYSAIGQTTHLAARMEQLAPPGTIRLTADTLRLAEGYVEIQPLGPVPVKGLESPIEVYEITGVGPLRSRFQAAAARGLTRFVGRETEVEHLRQALVRAAAGRGQVVAVVGEAGVGKSRLVWEVTHSHRTHGWLILGAGAVSYSRATPYRPVIDLLKRYFRIEDRDDQRTIREKVIGRLVGLDRTLEPTASVFLALLDVPIEDPQWQALDSSQRRQRSLDAVRRLLLRESQVQPLLVVFEDLHWIDTETQAVLDSLVASLPTACMVLLVSYRPEYQHGWVQKTYYTQLRLDPLPPESARELLETLLGVDDSVQPLKLLLVERTEGNPFFLEESVRTLAETMALVGARGGYRLAKALPEIQVPPTVQSVLAARIDRLPPEQKQLLQSASVVGKDVPVGLLHAVADLPDESLVKELSHLQAAEFLYETALFPEPEYTFKHALTLEVAYGSLLNERRRQLHRRVLEHLERDVSPRLAEHAERLAHHARRGEVWDRAARYLYLAGERAFAYAAYSVGGQLFEAAVDAVDHEGDRGDLALKLDAYLELWVMRVETGRVQGLDDLADKTEALAVSLNDRSRLAQLRVRQAQALGFYTASVALDSAVERAKEALSLAHASDLRTRSYAHVVAGGAYRHLGRFREGIDELDAGIVLLRTLDPARETQGLVLPIYVTLSVWKAETHAALGEFEEALAAAREALRIANQIAHLPSCSFANAFMGHIHILKGDIETALPFLETGLAVGEDTDQSTWRVTNDLYLGYGLVLLGQHQQGIRRLARVNQIWGSGAYGISSFTKYGSVTASAYLEAGRLAEAQTEVAQGLSLATRHNVRGHLAPLLRLQGELKARLEPSDLAEALRLLHEAIALANELGMRPELAHCHLGLGRLYRKTGDGAKAEEHLSTAVTMYRQMNMGYWVERAEAEL